jgi:hypothetical protein
LTERFKELLNWKQSSRSPVWGEIDSFGFFDVGWSIRAGFG